MDLLKKIQKVCIASSFLCVVQVHAGTTTWEWDLAPGSAGNSVTTCTNNCPTSSFNVTDTNGSESVTAGFTAWSDNNETGGTGLNPDGNADPYITGGSMYYWGDNNGWGMVNNDETGGSPEHAFDNQGNSIDYDMVLVSFDSSVELTGINFGWVSDGDFTLLAYDGASNTSPILNNTTWASIAGSGDWLTVGQYNGGPTDTYYSVNTGPTAVSSQYWLIGAYNSVFGTPTDGRVDANDDAFKIRKITGKTTTAPKPPTEVSAPGTIGVFLLSSLFIVQRRRNKTSTKA
ncbi:MAG: hypothetical protein GW763_09375 [Paraglaciecola sp.]|nr:hypothetical protein [Paraglaciecola sp.]NCT48179.1 hypothetical protein [Paraglaciecola sp.]